MLACFLLAAGLAVGAPAEVPAPVADSGSQSAGIQRRFSPEEVKEYKILTIGWRSSADISRFFRLPETVVAEFKEQFVRSMAFSPDGKTLATGGRGLALWNLKSGESVALRDATINAVAFFPDGKRLAVVARPAHRLGELRVHRTADLALVARPDQDVPYVSDASVSPDGKQIAAVVGSATGGLRLFNAAAQQQHVFNIAGGYDLGMQAAYSPDGKLIACGPWMDANLPDVSRTDVVLWDVRASKRRATLEQTPLVNSLEFSADGKLLATADRPMRDSHTVVPFGPPVAIRTWDTKTSKQSKSRASGWNFSTMSQQAHGRVSMSFSPDGKILATGGYRTVCLWGDHKLRLMLKAPSAGDAVVKFSPDGSKLAIGGGKTVMICDTAKLLALAAEGNKP